jgi:hypothetical protein
MYYLCKEVPGMLTYYGTRFLHLFLLGIFDFSDTEYIHPTMEFIPFSEIQGNYTQISRVLYTTKKSHDGKKIMEAVKRANSWKLKNSFVVQYVDDLTDGQVKELSFDYERDCFEKPLLVEYPQFKFGQDGIFQALGIKKVN